MKWSRFFFHFVAFAKLFPHQIIICLTWCESDSWRIRSQLCVYVAQKAKNSIKNPWIYERIVYQLSVKKNWHVDMFLNPVIFKYIKSKSQNDKIISTWRVSVNSVYGVCVKPSTVAFFHSSMFRNCQKCWELINKYVDEWEMECGWMAERTNKQLYCIGCQKWLLFSVNDIKCAPQHSRPG